MRSAIDAHNQIMPDGLGDHALVAAGIAEPVQGGQFLALVGVQAGEGIAAAARGHGVDDVVDLVAEQPLHVEHGAEVLGAPCSGREVAVLAVHRRRP